MAGKRSGKAQEKTKAQAKAKTQEKAAAQVKAARESESRETANRGAENRKAPNQESVDGWLAHYSVPARVQEMAARRSDDDGRLDARHLLTGIEAIDKALGGGVLSPGLTVLGAAPGIGKTTLALQVALHIARMEPERKVLFFSLEMAAQALVPKIQSCCNHAAARARRAAVTAQAEDAEAQRPSFDALPENFYIIDDRTPRPAGEAAWTAPAISSVVKRVLASRGDDALRPLVIVDYLQFIPPTKEGAEERIRVNEALQEFSGITDRAAVMLISSLNRSAYNRPIQEEAFKETGLIEFSADVLLGMQYSAVNAVDTSKSGVPSFNRVQEAAKNPREVELVVLKNRYAGIGAQVPLHFYPRENYFVAVEEDDPIAANDPFYINIAWRIADRLRSPRGGDEEWTEGGRRVFAGAVKRTQLRNRRKLQQPIDIGYRIEQPEDAPINAFDMVVADAIYTLYRRGLQSFTAANIQQLITGGRQSYAKRNEAIRNSIEKLRASMIHIDCTSWAELDRDYFRGREDQVGALARFMAFLNVDPTGSSSRPRYGFTDAHPLPLYLYAEWTSRFVEASSGLFDLAQAKERDGQDGAASAKGGKDAFSYTPGNVVMMHYLIEQIEQIRNQSNRRTKPQIVLFRTDGDGRPMGAFARAGAASADEARKLLSKEKAASASKPLTYIMDRFCDGGYISSYEWGREDRDDLVVSLKI